MTATGGATSRGGSARWILLVLAAVALTVILLPSRETDRPYDLDSAQPGGYRGLRLLLEETGTSVDRVDASDVGASFVTEADTVFVPEASGAGAALTRQWRSYVQAGGRLVLGAPADGLGPPADPMPAFGGGVAILPGTCTLEPLAAGQAVRMPVDIRGVWVAQDESCYGNTTSALIVRRPLGDGEIVTLASPDLFANSFMGAPEPDRPVGKIPDNAVLAEYALAQGPAGSVGSHRLAVVTSGIAAAPDGTKGLTDFMSPGVKLGILELGAAFLFYALARGRRHGRVVTEPAPVTIAGSAFVEAVGSLLERQGDHGRAAEVLRAGECRELARRLGLPPDISRHDLAAIVAHRTGREPAAVERLLTDPIESDAALVDITRALDSLRQEALHV